MLFSFILALCVCVPCLLFTLLFQAYKKRKVILEQNLQKAESIYIKYLRSNEQNSEYAAFLIKNINSAKKSLKEFKFSVLPLSNNKFLNTNIDIDHSDFNSESENTQIYSGSKSIDNANGVFWGHPDPDDV